MPGRRYRQPRANDRNPWAISASAGFWITPSGTLDQTKPIFFVRFNESLNGPLVARQPMTIGALLELRSIAAEIATFREWLELQPADEQSVARTLFRRNRIAEFYEPELTTYTAAAHFLSVSIREPDFIPVCHHGAALADLCLNASPKQFQRLRHPLEGYSASDLRFLVDEAAREALKNNALINYEFFQSAMRFSLR
jgi:hypothetical protein